MYLAHLHAPTCRMGLTFGYMWQGGGGVPTSTYICLQVKKITVVLLNTLSYLSLLVICTLLSHLIPHRLNYLILLFLHSPTLWSSVRRGEIE